MNKIATSIITMMHIFFFVFVILVPFYGNMYLSLLHLIVVPFVMAHWVMSNNSCALTLMEQKIREQMNGGGSVDSKDCYMGNLMEPIYDFVLINKDYAGIIYTVTASLWGYCLYRFIKTIRSGKIKTIHDVLRL